VMFLVVHVMFRVVHVMFRVVHVLHLKKQMQPFHI